MTLTDRVSNVLDDLSAELSADGDRSINDLRERDSLRELADRADELVSTAKATDLLSAVGLADGGERPESIPEAVVSGDEADVVSLRLLLTLAKLADDWADDEAWKTLDDLAFETDFLDRAAESEPSETDETADDEGAAPLEAIREALEAGDEGAEEAGGPLAALGGEGEEALGDEGEGLLDALGSDEEGEGLLDALGGDEEDAGDAGARKGRSSRSGARSGRHPAHHSTMPSRSARADMDVPKRRSTKSRRQQERSE
ncbi:hypothetical protein ACNS7O_13660 [Haloferacaceae archaeon DSL9]